MRPARRGFCPALTLRTNRKALGGVSAPPGANGLRKKRNSLSGLANGKETQCDGPVTSAAMPFVAIERYTMNCPAWASLSLAGRCAYFELLKAFDGSNNGKLALSANMLASKLPVGRATAGRALEELTAKGFIAAVRQGGFNMKSGLRRATEWRLNCYRCDVTGALPSKEFMRWQDGKISFDGLATEQQRSHHGATELTRATILPVCCSDVRPVGRWRTNSRSHHRAPYRIYHVVQRQGAREAEPLRSERSARPGHWKRKPCASTALRKP